MLGQEISTLRGSPRRDESACEFCGTSGSLQHLQHSHERLVDAREEERSRLGRELHDGLGSALSYLAFGLDVASKLVTHEPKAAEALLVRLKDQAQGAVSDLRGLVHGLHPPALDTLGLILAIRQLAESYRVIATEYQSETRSDADHKAGTVFSVLVPRKLPPLPAVVELACYRIAQEAMTNVARHAHARTCQVRLSVDAAIEALELQVIDDGVGFSKARRVGVGLASMRERAAELGGTCEVESGPGGGTRVMARLTLIASEKHPEG
jgi:two-component system NarL family sensor kinase